MDLLHRYISTTQPRVVATAPDGETIVAYDAIAPRPVLTPDRPLLARFGNAIDVTGFDVPTDVSAGRPLTIRWYWKIVQTASQELKFFNQLIDEGGNRRGQLDDRAFAPDYWPAGTVGVSTFDVPIDSETKTGIYSMIAGVYDKKTLDRLPIYDVQGQPAGTQILLGQVKVHGIPVQVPEPTEYLRLQTSDAIALLGYDLAPPQPHPGQPLTVTFHWTANARPAANYAVFVHLLGSDGKIVAQTDGAPKSGQAPTSLWDAGDSILDPHSIDLPKTLDPGQYRLEVGWYRPTSGERLSFTSPNGTTASDHFVIDEIAVGLGT